MGEVHLSEIISINGFSSQKLDNVNIDKYNVFGVVETWTNSESNTSLPGFRAMHEPDVKQNGKRGVLVAL